MKIKTVILLKFRSVFKTVLLFYVSACLIFLPVQSYAASPVVTLIGYGVVAAIRSVAVQSFVSAAASAANDATFFGPSAIPVGAGIAGFVAGSVPSATPANPSSLPSDQPGNLNIPVTVPMSSP